MADGMILNFAVDPNATAASQKFKGGSWKDRVRAKRAARFNAQRKDDSSKPLRVLDGAPRSGPNAEDFPDPRPAKRRRENGPTGEHTSNGTVTRKPASADRTRINADG